MEDPSLHIFKGISIVNLILNYFYLGLLVMCFILALGNRPQGSKASYTLAMVGFAIVTVYMTVRNRSMDYKLETSDGILCPRSSQHFCLHSRA